MYLQMGSVAIAACPIGFLATNASSESNHKPVTRQIKIMGHPIRQLRWAHKICQCDEKPWQKLKGTWQLNAVQQCMIFHWVVG